MKKFLRRLVGIDNLEDEVNELSRAIYQYNERIAKLTDRTRELSLACARLLAVVEPNYIRDPMSAEARAESDKIAKQVLSKLIAEHQAAVHSTGEEP